MIVTFKDLECMLRVACNTHLYPRPPKFKNDLKMHLHRALYRYFNIGY